jgi:hypothetical protein
VKFQQRREHHRGIFVVIHHENESRRAALEGSNAGDISARIGGSLEIPQV